MDQIKVGLTGNLKDYTFVARTGETVKGSEVSYNGSPTGYAADPSESVQYVDAHDNETLYDSLAFKLPQDTPMADRVRMNTVSLSTVVLGQGVAFFHAGSDILRSKSLDRNSYNSGDWFNRVDWSLEENTFGSGLPPKTDNESKWPFMKPLLADESLDPDTAAMQAATAAFQDLLEIRDTSPLLHLGKASLIQKRVSFPLPSNASPGVIVMSVDDTKGKDLDSSSEGLLVVFNSTDEAVAPEVPGAAGATYALHPAQADGSDPVVRTATFDAASGAFSVPARTVAVFSRS
jgi:pullulanase/glycogen debranching enzyme